MSARTWVIADPHFGHAGICRFLRPDGSKLRPWDSSDDMDKALISNWNRVVEDQDRVYVLGDVVMNRRYLRPTLLQLRGRKVLVKGNHDIFKLSDYAPYFDDIQACCVGKYEGYKYILTHVPIHPESLGRSGINIHGHTHSNSISDPRYLCVSVEQISYTPMLLQHALARIKEGLYAPTVS
jgi:calcineurin-like phosphoesterase family protein